MYIYIKVGIKVGNKVGSASVGSVFFFAIADCVCVLIWVVVTHLYDHAVLYPLLLYEGMTEDILSGNGDCFW